ncbi:hypothetical protein ABMY44_10680 [Pseudoalteromonas sp. Cnat2-41]|uniref:hypothetical protein n=1 Tax=unclassified Pseudoalteromonas TaxID=194690 RepID=UPI001EF8E23A|nr:MULTISPECIES: hypothetical protein [unclassified Pseudoalteromonas]MCF2863538.1 hypothetical protein [Pseudoalteromonas sp. CNAT2-18]MCG7558491.1 hypothetical protein [Pseudoalteromonas sp. CNAT2-18.1]
MRQTHKRGSRKSPVNVQLVLNTMLRMSSTRDLGAELSGKSSQNHEKDAFYCYSNLRIGSVTVGLFLRIHHVKRNTYLETDLQQKLTNIFSTRLFKFNGLPEKVISELNALMLEYGAEQLLLACQALRPKFEQNADFTRGSRGKSGLGGEFYMAAAMELKYLQEAMVYIRSKTTGAS